MNRLQLFIEARDDLNLSVIFVPTSLEEFRHFCAMHKDELQLNGLEVVVALQHDVNKDALNDFVIKFSLVNWLIIDVGKCTFASAINKCLLGTSKKKIAIYIHIDLLIARHLFDIHYKLHRYLNSFLTIVYKKPLQKELSMQPFALFCWRTDLLKIGEAQDFQHPTLVLENLARRLQKVGIKKLSLFSRMPSEAKINDGIDADLLPSTKRQVYYPTFAKTLKKARRESIIYDWKRASLGYERCAEYIKSFKQAEIVQKNSFEKHLRIIALIQTHNEIDNMPAVLEHLDNYCDGIIMLDDESTDGTFEKAVSQKLLLKVQKVRNGFEDTRNRNILMDLVSFFFVDWIFTLDADERFDKRYDGIYSLLDSKYDVLGFRYVNLWDNEHTYRVDFDPTNHQGVALRRRMFRNMGRSQIYSLDNKKIHVNPVPTTQPHEYTPILILHYGTLTSQERLSKVEFYLKEDPIEINYETWYRFYEDTKVVVADIKDIKL